MEEEEKGKEVTEMVHTNDGEKSIISFNHSIRSKFKINHQFFFLRNKRLIDCYFNKMKEFHNYPRK